MRNLEYGMTPKPNKLYIVQRNAISMLQNRELANKHNIQFSKKDNFMNACNSS